MHSFLISDFDLCREDPEKFWGAELMLEGKWRTWSQSCGFETLSLYWSLCNLIIGSTALVLGAGATIGCLLIP